MPQQLPEDLYGLLSGGGPEATGNIANELRRRKDLGFLYQLSGDQVMSPIGQGIDQETNKYMEGLADSRDKSEGRRVLENWYKAQEDSNAENARLRGEELDYNYFKTVMDNQGKLDVAGQARLNRPIPKGISDELTELGETARGLNLVTNITPFKKEWESAPFLRPFKNTLASYGLGTQDWKDSQAWQANLKRGWDMAARYSYFGATLTDNELREWQKASIGENFDKEQVDTALKKINDALAETIKARVAGHSQGYDENAIQSFIRAPAGYLEKYGMTPGVGGAAPADEDAFAPFLNSMEITQ
jgi:hypothetical protein